MQSILYNIVDKDQLSKMLNTFYQCMDVQIQVLGEDGTILMSCGNTASFCALFKKRLPPDESCSKLHTNASKTAIQLGEPYIFTCHAGLNHIVLPLIHKNVLLGSILVGPFLMEDADSVLIENITKKYPFTTLELLELYDESKSLRIVHPAKVTHMSNMLYYMFSGLIADSRYQLSINNSKLHQQSLINESIQMYKTSGAYTSDTYPFDKERLLITKLKIGNTEEAKALLNDLLGYVFFSHGNNLEIIKSRSLELCSLLSRAAIEGGATSDSILKVNNHLLTIIPSIDSIDELCYTLQETLDAFTECMFKHVPGKNNELIKKAIQYIVKNFAESVSLDDVASHVHLNPAYFSTIFKQCTGSSFREYLNMVRIEESKRLLSNTDYSLIDIAIATGFENQSYFSRIFKKYTGMTPKQFR